MAPDSSPPTSPRSVPSEQGNKAAAQPSKLRLKLAPFRLEHLYDYEPGGHHPIHLHDVQNGRYRVIHKLGNGGFSNVWLCRDLEARETTTYVALKILMAEASESDYPETRINQFKDWLIKRREQDDAADPICLPLDQFTIDGPNGHHACFVYPLLGPKVSLGLFQATGDPDKSLRNISHRIVKAISLLHDQGICHGDITPNNALHHTRGFDGLTEGEVLQILGAPTQNPIFDGPVMGHAEPTAPQYLVYPVEWEHVAKEYISEQSCLIDFGQSFEVANTPEYLGIPGPYRSPELMLDNSMGFGTDLWALGCTLFEIRTGRKLFCPFDNDDEDYLDLMVQILGKLPEPWWSTTWETRKTFWKDELDEQGRAIPTVAEPPPPADGITRIIHPSVAQGARSLTEKLRPGLWYLSENIHRDIPQKEMDVFSDLLGKLLRYTPGDRISAAAALDHEWFAL
ncbi:kinase-like domain-containing protein [Dactylonectria macrodidyma]|uniref:non-specific serine/threonine protein kinase n=1 Tax=Dactylonectria macrodidyma TaxID=307937 RepID=A0A9P9IUA8_9HYPO|nr:kinase-like domain-containing protein [Dactylonectria macrodidyma]